VDFFYYLTGGLEDLDGHGLLADEALQLLDPLLELADPAGRNDVLASRHRGRPATLDKPHPVSNDARRNAELSRELGKGLLTRRDPGHGLALERHRKDPPTICLPRKLHHDSQPF
jgi:hypothetical protein